MVAEIVLNGLNSASATLLNYLANETLDTYLFVINKRLPVCLGGHNFSTLMLAKGISIESVPKILEHTSITTAQIYGKGSKSENLDRS